ncbi:hypothetical protein FQN57_005117 [Myotisia sp. PD_48]|nr:hypothetical protein FQN57_005117 [Myotisia sp. PD_48]
MEFTLGPWTAIKNPCVLLLLLLCFRTIVQATSIISTFTDTNCQDSFKSFEGPNGYPNGTCSTLSRNGNFSSFQVVQLDDECTVTIYGKNEIPESPCSSKITQLAELATCYNSSWIYYSIDFCTVPTASQTPTPTPKSSSSPAIISSTSYTGALVGGIVGGIAVIAGVAGLIWCLCFHPARRRGNQAAVELDGGIPPKPPMELTGSPTGVLSPVTPFKPKIWNNDGTVSELGADATSPIELEAANPRYKK